MKFRSVAHVAFFLALLVPAFAQNGKPDAEGFVRDWLVLGPYPIGETPGAEVIDVKQFPEEAQPTAVEGAKQKFGTLELSWRKIAAKEFFVDFREVYPAQPEQAIVWAVAYVVSPDEKTELTLRMNSNDQGKAYLNGKELVKFVDTRTLEKDTEDKAANVTLKKGVNVLVLKVVNEVNNWQGSVRFLDKAGKPLTDLKVETKR